VYSYVNSTSATDNPTYNTSTFAKLSAQVYQAGTGVFSIKPIIGTNTASGYASNIAGGQSNTASANYSNVAGGQSNTASGNFSNVAGGRNNTASGNFSNVAGGQSNNAFGNYSSILGGINNNTNNQACSFIVGQGIIASQPNFTYVNNISSQGLVYDATGNSNQWNTAYSIVSGGIVSTLNLPQSAVWQSTTATVSSLSGGWQSAYTWTQNNSAIATFSTSVSTNYVYCTSLSSTYVYGNSSETTLTDGANLTGNGAGTLTLNYSSGVYIGSNTIPTIDNSYNFGNGTNRWKAIYAANGTIQTSDARQKTNIIPSPLGLEFITTLNPVSYNFIIGSNEIEKDQDGNITAVIPVSGKRTHFGLLAQEVQQVIPQGIDFGGWILTDLNDPNSYQGLRYEEFIAPMIKSIQELSSIVNDLKIENQQLWTIVNSLTSK
jgi:hypothetical protein